MLEAGRLSNRQADMLDEPGRQKHSRLAVLGAGSWGSALALVLAGNGHEVNLWGHDSQHVVKLFNEKQNQRHLPGITFPSTIHPTTCLGNAINDATAIVIAVPSRAFVDLIEQLATVNKKSLPVLIATKGLQPGSGGLLHSLVEHRLARVDVAVLSGPSFAGEVAAGLPTAVTIAAKSHATATVFARPFHTPSFRPYTSTDLIGVQLGGAVKNVMAVATGIAEGLALGANTQAGLITRGLAELRRLGVAMGAEPNTFMGLSGVGDMVLTCTDNQSRNRRFGYGIGRGEEIQAITQKIGQTVEAITTASEVCALADVHHVDMPICQEVTAIIKGERNPNEALTSLMQRPLGEEFPNHH